MISQKQCNLGSTKKIELSFQMNEIIIFAA